MEQLAELSIISIALATAASFFLGFLWYNVLFTKPWMAAMGVTSEDVRSSRISIGWAVMGSLGASLATATGLAIIFALIPTLGWGVGLFLALLVWIAFSLTPMFKMIFWEDRPIALFVIDGGFEFFSIFAVTIVLLAWS